MNFDISQLLQWSYYTETHPQGDFLWGFLLLVFFFLLVFINPILRRLAPQNKYFRKSIKRRMGKFIALGVLGIISVLSRFSEIPMFSMRLWLYIILFLSVVFGVWTFIKVRKDYQKRIQAVKREKTKKKRKK